jgi:HD-like signal output (HDOD) protein
MTAKILQVVNSAYFGVRRHVSTAEMAIKLLGLDNIRSLVLFANVFSDAAFSVSVKGLSMENLWTHSGTAGRFCQLILKEENKSKDEIDNALTAGLLHDCGKLILAANSPSGYEEAIDIARREKIFLYEAEKRIFGVSHAEAGAYLLGLWGLPDPIVEAVAFHHTPCKVKGSGISLVTAVHAANAFEHSMDEGSDSGFVQLLDMEYIKSIGAEEKVESWQNVSA